MDADRVGRLRGALLVELDQEVAEADRSARVRVGVRREPGADHGHPRYLGVKCGGHRLQHPRVVVGLRRPAPELRVVGLVPDLDPDRCGISPRHRDREPRELVVVLRRRMELIIATGAGAGVVLGVARGADQHPQGPDPAREHALVGDVGAVPVERAGVRLDPGPGEARARDLGVARLEQVERRGRREDPVLVEAEGRAGGWACRAAAPSAASGFRSGRRASAFGAGARPPSRRTRTAQPPGRRPRRATRRSRCRSRPCPGAASGRSG